jgi:imidazole glycerol-phosphate synthase subunit HisF
MVRRVADSVFIPFTVGGGIRTVDDMRAILRSGADKVSVNSAAVRNAGADHRGRAPSSAASAWSWPSTARAARALGSLRQRRPHADRPGRRGSGRRRRSALGAGEILLTSMDADGTQAGYDLALTGGHRERSRSR